MSPCGADEACRCCHRFLVLLNVFTSFSCFSCSCVLDINFWAVFTCKVNVYHKNCFSWLRGNLCQFPCGSDWSCLPFFDYFSFHFFFQYQIFLVLNATTTSLSDSEILHAPGCILISWEVFEKFVRNKHFLDVHFFTGIHLEKFYTDNKKKV